MKGRQKWGKKGGISTKKRAKQKKGGAQYKKAESPQIPPFCMNGRQKGGKMWRYFNKKKGDQKKGGAQYKKAESP